jgi:AraC family transcriptional regulator of adaptative response/methylated-DNA-[protein]-cysteine methyltransferase
MATIVEHQVNRVGLAEEAQWHGVLGKDSHFDGVFVYAVRSTGVYCRPSCPSRKPAREQVVFFPIPELAEAEGFRPCKRCEPHQAAAPDPQLEMVRETCRILQESPEPSPTLSQLGHQVGCSPYHLQRVFKRITGLTPRQYADAHRWKNLKANLKNGHSVTHALYEAGYGSSSRLYESASSELGMTPGDYRRGGTGLSITYTVLVSPLGWVLIAATQRGVCAVSLGDHEEALVEELRGEFPQAEIKRDDQGLGKWAYEVVEHLTNRVPGMEVPLDIRATAFQRLVWEELQRVPRGETRSYSQIARAIGRPTAARAVAQACSKNPVAVIIPCHRVLREDGGLGGYRWGLSRKQALLNQEGVSSTGP